MNILVAGGTGFIGSHIIDELLQRADSPKILCLSRNPTRGNRWGSHVEMVQGDVKDQASLERATRGVDLVVHCVQFPNHPVENRRRGWTYLEVDGQGTVRMVEVCRKNSVKRFLYLSGAGTSPEKTQPWFRAKVMAETGIKQSGMEYVIFRPSWIYGPEDRSLNKFVFFTRYLPFIPVIGNGKGKVQPVSVFDVAKVVAKAVDHPEATNKIFELGGPEVLTMDEILLTVQKVMGKKRPLLHHPIGFMKFVTSFMAILPNPPLSPSAIDFITMEEIVDNSEARKVFGVTFERLEDGLRRYLNSK
ncbi:MAG: NAD-dependent epimerase/dehydratase family protein [Candidatus Tectomicrobia bacterium]|nr:NAD-dependent epimerase/dehydratase family protein [Candidatus Tectomicrobia bacterium]